MSKVKREEGICQSGKCCAQVIDVTYSDKMIYGDFNNDGVFDIAMINEKENNIGVFLGNQNGTFQSAQIFPVGNHQGK